MKNKNLQDFFSKRFLSLKWYELEKITDKWGFIRQSYMEALPEIITSARADHRRWCRSYVLDWEPFLNDYEKMAWSSIRSRGSVVLYPQFPVFNNFIDFANPYLRIGLEIDGKQHDPVKDSERDKLLAHIGWKIFRVPAREAHTEYKDISELTEYGIEGKERSREVRHWLLHSLDGVVQSIEWLYFCRRDNNEDSLEEWQNFIAWAEESLIAHRLVDFPLRKNIYA